jgi:hypothetical protein
VQALGTAAACGGAGVHGLPVLRLRCGREPDTAGSEPTDQVISTARIGESVNRVENSIDGTCDSVAFVLLPRTLAAVMERTTCRGGVSQALGRATVGCGAEVQGWLLGVWCRHKTAAYLAGSGQS